MFLKSIASGWMYWSDYFVYVVHHPVCTANLSLILPINFIHHGVTSKCMYSLILHLFVVVFSPPSPSFCIVCHAMCVNLHICSMSCDHHVVVVLMSLLLILFQCDYVFLPCMMCMNGWYNSPNEVPSIDAPSPVSPSPSPTLPLEPQTQIEKNQSKTDQEKEEWTPSTPCNEVHATGLRRSSEPLPCSLPEPYAEPPREAVNHLTVTSEQRSLP